MAKRNSTKGQAASTRAKSGPAAPASANATRNLGPDSANQVTDQPLTPIDSGTASLSVDRHRIATLFVNDVPSSSINLDCPEQLDFEYLRWMAQIIHTERATIDHATERTAGRGSTDPNPNSATTVLHLGGAGCALAQALVRSMPNSHHTAVEIDAALAQLVRAWLPLPRAPHVKIRVGDARTVLESSQQKFNAIVRDVFSGKLTPEHLTTVEYTQSVADKLLDGGIYLANCADRVPFKLLANELATLQRVFPQVAIVGEPRHLNGRGFGNVVLIAGHGALSDGLARELLKDPVPPKLVQGSALAKFNATGKPIHDPQSG